MAESGEGGYQKGAFVKRRLSPLLLLSPL